MSESPIEPNPEPEAKPGDEPEVVPSSNPDGGRAADPVETTVTNRDADEVTGDGK